MAQYMMGVSDHSGYILSYPTVSGLKDDMTLEDYIRKVKLSEDDKKALVHYIGSREWHFKEVIVKSLSEDEEDMYY